MYSTGIYIQYLVIMYNRKELYKYMTEYIYDYHFVIYMNIYITETQYYKLIILQFKKILANNSIFLNPKFLTHVIYYKILRI